MTIVDVPVDTGNFRLIDKEEDTYYEAVQIK